MADTTPIPGKYDTDLDLFSKFDPATASDEDTRAMQKYVGTEVDGKWGVLSKGSYENKYRELQAAKQTEPIPTDVIQRGGKYYKQKAVPTPYDPKVEEGTTDKPLQGRFDFTKAEKELQANTSISDLQKRRLMRQFEKIKARGEEGGDGLDFNISKEGENTNWGFNKGDRMKDRFEGAFDYLINNGGYSLYKLNKDVMTDGEEYTPTKVDPSTIDVSQLKGAKAYYTPKTKADVVEGGAVQEGVEQDGTSYQSMLKGPDNTGNWYDTYPNLAEDLTQEDRARSLQDGIKTTFMDKERKQLTDKNAAKKLAEEAFLRERKKTVASIQAALPLSHQAGGILGMLGGLLNSGAGQSLMGSAAKGVGSLLAKKDGGQDSGVTEGIGGAVGAAAQGLATPAPAAGMSVSDADIAKIAEKVKLLMAVPSAKMGTKILKGAGGVSVPKTKNYGFVNGVRTWLGTNKQQDDKANNVTGISGEGSGTDQEDPNKISIFNKIAGNVDFDSILRYQFNKPVRTNDVPLEFARRPNTTIIAPNSGMSTEQQRIQSQNAANAMNIGESGNPDDIYSSIAKSKIIANNMTNTWNQIAANKATSDANYNTKMNAKAAEESAYGQNVLNVEHQNNKEIEAANAEQKLLKQQNLGNLAVGTLNKGKRTGEMLGQIKLQGMNSQYENDINDYQKNNLDKITRYQNTIDSVAPTEMEIADAKIIDANPATLPSEKARVQAILNYKEPTAEERKAAQAGIDGIYAGEKTITNNHNASRNKLGFRVASGFGAFSNGGVFASKEEIKAANTLFRKRMAMQQKSDDTFLKAKIKEQKDKMTQVSKDIKAVVKYNEVLKKRYLGK